MRGRPLVQVRGREYSSAELDRVRRAGCCRALWVSILSGSYRTWLELIGQMNVLGLRRLRATLGSHSLSMMRSTVSTACTPRNLLGF